MNWTIAIGVAVVVVVLGGVAAILWWNLANKAAPYGDQRGTPRRERDEGIVIKDEGKAR